MPGVDFRLLRESIPLEDVLGELGFEAVQERGDVWRGVCPITGSSNPQSKAFKVDVSRQTSPRF